MNPLPPQAYTKETMVKAYQWLQHQSDKIKEMATSPDILVSLYLKAKLQGDAALERPSIQNFKNELKSLAGMMGEFEVVDPDGAFVPPPTPQPKAPPPPLMNFAPPPFPAASPAPASAPSVPPKTRADLELDPRSMLMIQEVKTQLNLSSDYEALRMLVSVGHSKVKSLLSEK